MSKEATLGKPENRICEKCVCEEDVSKEYVRRLC